MVTIGSQCDDVPPNLERRLERLLANRQMAKHLTIGEFADAAGVPTSTIRYYERARLLKPSSRSASNYRLYSADDLERLRFIRAAQA